MLRSLVAFSLAAVAALACGGSANAAVTATEISSPSPAAVYPTWNPYGSVPELFTVGGTATGSGPVRFWCDGVAPDGSVVAGSSLTQNPLDVAGAFTADLRLWSLSPGFGGCRLRALPSDGLPADLSPFRGPLLFRQGDGKTAVASGPNAGRLRDYRAMLNQRRSGAEMTSVSSCGLCGLAATEDDRAGEWAWWTASWLDGFRTDATRTAAMVDGQKSLFASDLYDTPWDDYANLPGIESTQVTTASATSAGRVSASEQPVHCTTDVGSSGSGYNREPDPSTCAALVPAGVRFDRSYTPLDASGRSWRVTDVIHSIDGSAHELDLAYRNEAANRDAPRIQVPWAADAGWQTWATATGDHAVPARLPATLYTQFNSDKPQGFENPIGALVAGPGLAGVTIDTEQSLTITTRYRRTVPANGSVTIEQAVIGALSEAEARSFAAQAETALTPPVDPPPSDGGGTTPPHVDPPPAPGPRPAPDPAPAPRDTTKPALSRLARTRTGFRATLSEPARLTIAISRRDAGRRSGRACKKPSRALRRAKRCTRLTRVGRITAAGRQGVNAIAFSGKLGRRSLKPGSYQASFSARDTAGNISAAKVVAFTVKRR